MKHLYLIIVVSAWLSSCSSRSETTEMSDSTITDTTTFVDQSDSTFVSPTDAPDIVASVMKLLSDDEIKGEEVYTLKLTASGFEYQTEQVWSFDSLQHLVHCAEQWASEGVEGTSHHLFKRERLYAVHDETVHDGGKEVNVYHKELGGVVISYNGTADSTANTLEKKYFTDAENDLKRQLGEIVKLLKDNKTKIEDEGDPVTVKVENNHPDEELPGKETTEITVDRKLLDTLLK
jgi:hypothetical protein